MICNGSEVGLFVRFPQVLVYSKKGATIIFEIPKDLDLLIDRTFEPIPGSIMGYKSQHIQFRSEYDYNFLRYPEAYELAVYEQGKYI